MRYTVGIRMAEGNREDKQAERRESNRKERNERRKRAKTSVNIKDEI